MRKIEEKKQYPMTLIPKESAVQSFVNMFSLVLIGCHLYEIWHYPHLQFWWRIINWCTLIPIVFIPYIWIRRFNDLRQTFAEDYESSSPPWYTLYYFYGNLVITVFASLPFFIMFAIFFIREFIDYLNRTSAKIVQWITSVAGWFGCRRRNYEQFALRMNRWAGRSNLDIQEDWLASTSHQPYKSLRQSMQAAQSKDQTKLDITTAPLSESRNPNLIVATLPDSQPLEDSHEGAVELHPAVPLSKTTIPNTESHEGQNNF